MNLTFERAPALAAISRAIGAVERKNVIPILSNFALEAKGGRLALRANDTTMEVIETFPAEISQPGEITLLADKFSQIVGSADPGAQITLNLAEDDPRMGVRSGRSSFKVPTLPAADFPTFRGEGLEPPFSFPAKRLANMLARVRWAAVPNQEANLAGCVFLGVVDGELHAVGCGGFGVALAHEPAPEGAYLRAALPMKLVSQLIKWLGDAEGDVKVSAAAFTDEERAGYVLNRLIRVEHETGQITANLFDERDFFDYRRLLIDGHELTAETDQDALATAIRRVLIMQDKNSSGLHLTFRPGSVTAHLRNSSHIGDGSEEIAADYEGPEVTILLNAKLLQDALDALRGDRVKLAFAEVCRERDVPSVKVLVAAPADPSFTATLAQQRA